MRRAVSLLWPTVRSQTSGSIANDSHECETCRNALLAGSFECLGEGQFGAVYLVDMAEVPETITDSSGSSSILRTE